jgi:hypothetical protein
MKTLLKNGFVSETKDGKFKKYEIATQEYDRVEKLLTLFEYI